MSPAGKKSDRNTPVATSGPALVTVMVNAITSPTSGVGSLTVFDTTRSTKVGVMLDGEGVVLGKGVDLVSGGIIKKNVMVLAPVVESTVAVIVRVAVVVVATVPTVHTPLVKLPWLTSGNPTSVTPAGRLSVSTTPVAAFGPVLILLMDHLFRQIVDVHGCVMEFGTRWGQNMALFAALRGIYDPFNRHRNLVAFDTFTGFPDVSPEDGGHEMMEVGILATSEEYPEFLEAVLSLHESLNPLDHIKKFELRRGVAIVEVPRYLKDHPET